MFSVSRTLMGALIIALISINGAFAHTAIKQSNIPNDAILEELPETFTFSFGQPVGLVKFELFAVETHDEKNTEEKIDVDFEKPRGMRKEFAVPLPRLNPGSYLIKWRVMAKDGHVMNGEILFAFSPQP